MRVHCLQHEPFEDLGAIEYWLNKNKFNLSYTRFFESVKLPEINNVDCIIIMGGSMSVNDEVTFPWLVYEKDFIRKCIMADKVVLGICLGSQLIASALGSKVFKNNEKEIGWFHVYKNNNVQSAIIKCFPDEILVFHWHGETFDLPKDAELIASSVACKNQVFTIGNKVIGLQCHFETTQESLANLSSNCKAELIQAKFIQSEMEMKKENIIYTNMHEVLYKILDELLYNSK